MPLSNQETTFLLLHTKQVKTLINQGKFVTDTVSDNIFKFVLILYGLVELRTIHIITFLRKKTKPTPHLRKIPLFCYVFFYCFFFLFFLLQSYKKNTNYS